MESDLDQVAAMKDLDLCGVSPREGSKIHGELRKPSNPLTSNSNPVLVSGVAENGQNQPKTYGPCQLEEMTGALD